MKDKRYKKTITLLIISIIAAVSTLVIGVYSLWQQTQKQTKFNQMVTACFDITFEDGLNDISLDSEFPRTDTDGEGLNPYSFTLKNNCDTPFNYTIYLEDIKSNNYPNLSDYINEDYVKVKLDDSAPVILGTLNTIDSDNNTDYEIINTRKIVTRRLNGNATNNHSIRLWLDEDTPMSQMNKIFLSKVKIVVSSGNISDYIAINNDGVIYSYDPAGPSSVTIPATINGVRVKTIASDAFKGVRSGIVYKDENDHPLGDYNDFLSYVESQECPMESGLTPNCMIDFSFAYSKNFYNILTASYDTEEEFLEAIANVTEDDFYFVKYNNDSNTEQYEMIDSFISMYKEQMAYYNEMGAHINVNNIPVYVYGTDTIPNDDIGLEGFFALYYNGDWDLKDLGSKSLSSGEVGLLINSLDLSEAIYLEKIESRAFSNLEKLTTYGQYDQTYLNNNMDYKSGLTSLTFGNNDRNIEFGWGCFSGVNLSELTIYTTYHFPQITEDFGSDPDDTYAYLGAFGGRANIDHLTIKKGGNKTTFGNIVGNILDIPMETDGPRFNGYMSFISGYSLNNHIDTVTVGSGIKEFGNAAVPLAEVKYVNLSEGLEKIGDYAIWSMGYGSEELVIPSTVTSIGKRAFGYIGCTSMYGTCNGTLEIPASVTSIGEEAFARFAGSSLTFVTNNSQLTNIGAKAFSAYDGGPIIIPPSVTTVGSNAFEYMSGDITVLASDTTGYANDWAPRATIHN